MRSMCGADACCLAINFQSLFAQDYANLSGVLAVGKKVAIDDGLLGLKVRERILGLKVRSSGSR